MESIRALFHNDWIPGSQIFVAGSRPPMPPEGEIDAPIGGLLHVVPPGRRPMKMLSLRDKLRAPEEHFCCVETDGFPEEFHEEHRYVLQAVLTQVAHRPGPETLPQVRFPGC